MCEHDHELFQVVFACPWWAEDVANGSKIKPISLEGMFERYARGELDPKVN